MSKSTEEIPVTVELMASHDRRCVMIVCRANEKIKMGLLVSALDNFNDQLKAQFTKSAIEVPPKPSIIIP